MAYAHADIFKEVWSVDRKSRVDFLKRHDGLFEFREYAERVHVDGPHEGEPYWIPSTRSGLYSSLAEAEQGAITEIPWLGKLGQR
jgi:hypothetical protein